MADFAKTLNSIKFLDEMAKGRSFIHQLNPLIKFIITGLFLVVTVSFDKYQLARLFPLFLFPVFVILLADLPPKEILKRVLWVEPIIIGIGILNPFFDQQVLNIAGWQISRGWVTFLSIFVKGGLTVTAAILLVATTGMNNMAAAMRKLHIPRIFVVQLMLTYRYISVLVEEVGRLWQAYSLRAPGQKGIKLEAWGPLGGQLLLRTFDRAERVYQAMKLRGFQGEYPMTAQKKLNYVDWIFLLGWTLFFIIVRIYNIPGILGALGA